MKSEKMDLFERLLHVDHMARHLAENSEIEHGKDVGTVFAADLEALEDALSVVDPDEGHSDETYARLRAIFTGQHDAEIARLTGERDAARDEAQAAGERLAEERAKHLDARNFIRAAVVCLRDEAARRYVEQTLTVTRSAPWEIVAATAIKAARDILELAISQKTKAGPGLPLPGQDPAASGATSCGAGGPDPAPAPERKPEQGAAMSDQSKPSEDERLGQ